MIEYFVIEYTDGLEHRHPATMTGGYDSPQHDRREVLLRYPMSEWARLGEYQSSLEGFVEMVALRDPN